MGNRGGLPIPVDVQNLRVERGVRLTRVGIRGVRKPVVVRRPGKDVTLVVDLDLFVDLPSDQKGSHLSRNAEIIGEIVEESVTTPVAGLEYLASAAAESLLKRHPYASTAEVDAAADYFLERTTPLGRSTLERYRLLARASVRRGDGAERFIGVEVVGMTACPCAMETVRDRLAAEYPEAAPALDQLPGITHNQRNVTTLMLQVPEGQALEANDLVEIVEACMSSPTYELLKRSDEGLMVLNAHRHPKFVEDVVREVTRRVLDRYRAFPASVEVLVRSESEESIHKHNAVAELTASLGDLRAQDGAA